VIFPTVPKVKKTLHGKQSFGWEAGCFYYIFQGWHKTCPPILLRMKSSSHAGKKKATQKIAELPVIKRDSQQIFAGPDLLRIRRSAPSTSRYNE
jgi:hypothetical protein